MHFDATEFAAHFPYRDQRPVLGRCGQDRPRLRPLPPRGLPPQPLLRPKHRPGHPVQRDWASAEAGLSGGEEDKGGGGDLPHLPGVTAKIID